MRSRLAERARFSWLTTGEFAEQCGGVDADTVSEWRKAGWFRTTPDGIPECLNVASDPNGRPDYRFHPSAVARFYRERAA